MSAAAPNELLIAAESERLLANPLWIGAFEALERKYILAWRNSQASKPEEREKVYWLLTSLDEVKAQLTSHITTGKLIAKEMEAEAFRQRSQEVDDFYGGTDRAPDVV